MCPLSGRAKAKRRSPSTRTGRKRYLPPVGKRERLTPFVLAGLLLRFAAGVAARTGILAVGAGSRTILLPLHVNGRLLTGTGATTTSSLRIFFHSCHINLHETFGLKDLLARSVPRRRIRYCQRTIMKSLSHHPNRLAPCSRARCERRSPVHVEPRDRYRRLECDPWRNPRLWRRRSRRRLHVDGRWRVCFRKLSKRHGESGHGRRAPRACGRRGGRAGRTCSYLSPTRPGRGSRERGRPAAHGEGRTRRACSRRTWHLPTLEGEASPGCFHVGHHVRARRRGARRGGRSHSRKASHPIRCWRIACLPGGSRRDRGQGRRRPHFCRCPSGDLLGGARDGCDGGCRRPLRRDVVTAPAKSERSKLEPSEPPPTTAALGTLAGQLLTDVV